MSPVIVKLRPAAKQFPLRLVYTCCCVSATSANFGTLLIQSLWESLRHSENVSGKLSEFTDHRSAEHDLLVPNTALRVAGDSQLENVAKNVKIESKLVKNESNKYTKPVSRN